jgi:hypothetical protein
MPTNADIMEAAGQAFFGGVVVEGATQAMVLLQRSTVSGLGGAPPTPKDTGEARAGGAVAVNEESSHQPPRRTFSQPISETQVREAMRDMKPGDVAIWSSRVPHSIFLERGHSRQAPDGFLEPGAKRVRAAMQSWQPRGDR